MFISFDAERTRGRRTAIAGAEMTGTADTPPHRALHIAAILPPATLAGRTKPMPSLSERSPCAFDR